MSSNYDDVVRQLHEAGLRPRHGIELGKWVRCPVKDDREKRGWFSLHEIVTQSGTPLIVGSFGVWRGNDPGTQKVDVAKSDLSAEQRQAIRDRLAQDRRRAESERKRTAERAAQAAQSMWSRLSPEGESDYLVRKGVGAHGVRFSPSGAMAIPVLNVSGAIQGLQIIRGTDKSGKAKLGKEFWPTGMAKREHFHLIGLPVPGGVCLVCEGYATGASLHEATGLPVVIAWDAGNLGPVLDVLRKRYRGTRWLICADDDTFAKCQPCGARLDLREHPENCPSCGMPHTRSNTGVSDASTAALGGHASWVRPLFADEDSRRADWFDRGSKITDFNDLHLAEGLHVVRNQVEAHLGQLGWVGNSRARSTTPSGGEGSAPLRPIENLGDMLDRFSLVYGMGSVAFDGQEHKLVTLSDMRDACLHREIHREWMEHPERVIVRQSEVGFDPAGEDPKVRCNLWAGWPTVPKDGSCQKLLNLLRHMCSKEIGTQGRAERVYDWVLRWIAYPIQHPGAKMKTTVVIHGPQGTGKNLFFECVMAIYGEYGRVINQDALEDRFNDWASRKLFLIADEVVARADLYHVKNKLKAFITGDWIRINPKNVAAYDERNHCNLVFLSNETMPTVLDEDDRRHTVIWTPEKLQESYYREVMDEIANGGIAALHHYLLHIDLGEFGPGTLPPVTDAKDALIELSHDATRRFYYDWDAGDIPGLRLIPATTQDVFDAYRLWSARTGQKSVAPMHKLIDALERHHRMRRQRVRYFKGQSKAQATLLIPDRTEFALPPAGQQESWASEYIGAFRACLQDYKGQANE